MCRHLLWLPLAWGGGGGGGGRYRELPGLENTGKTFDLELYSFRILVQPQSGTKDRLLLGDVVFVAVLTNLNISNVSYIYFKP